MLIISQCNKRALVETRRVLDQFAERKGDRVWQTAITQQGLATLRKMLRKSARRNTAVACHWIRGKDNSEMLWFVGNLSRFNEHGSVPTNTTGNDILRAADENKWHTAEAIALLAGIAGLFHDFGKANKLFQKKLMPGAKPPLSEPYRHEWVSLRLFEAFVGDDTDTQWLTRLRGISAEDENEVLASFIRDSDNPATSPNPFYNLPQLARAIAWLIISHHRLPKLKDEKHEPDIKKIDAWLTNKKTFKPYWNSPQCEHQNWTDTQWQHVWDLSLGTPIRSTTWCQKARSMARRSLRLPGFTEQNWMSDLFSVHMARLTIMLADHTYSAAMATPVWQDKNYKACANTTVNSVTQKREIKQKLDEHNIGVAHNAYLLGKNMPELRRSLPSIGRHKRFKQRSTDARFRWQDKAYELASSVSQRSSSQGFFGVSMASTGCGKTFANARIMYGLAGEKSGCRFNVALGLRTLTLQTGDALRERLGLASDDLAVLIGSAAVRELHDRERNKITDDQKLKHTSLSDSGSESADALFEEHQYIRYDGSLEDGRLSTWLEKSPKLQQLLSAPVVVCTIDHLMPATDGDRGGKQIAPMLRLLTSDLVLDEPDDFGLEDLPALTRLVNWAGLLGSRVLLSSATLPPSLLKALFSAYSSGRAAFNAACGEPVDARGVCCAWFDEFSCDQIDIAEADLFAATHKLYVEKRIVKLKQAPVLRLAELLPVKASANDVESVVEAMSQTITKGISRLHNQHHQVDAATGKRVSIGLVRMANINPMIAVVQSILAQPPPGDSRIHYVVYHSQYPMLLRSTMETALDSALTRHNPEDLFQVPQIKKALEHSNEIDQIFIVFATAVAEVGRDHDYDWAIAEPSSMRSLIQLAGRIQRHRYITPAAANLLILSNNFKALQGAEVAYARPGFESVRYLLNSHSLEDILHTEQYERISAIPRITVNNELNPTNNLVDLEHAHLSGTLFGDPEKQMVVHAGLWWQHAATWCAELQRLMPFRRSQPDEEFVLLVEETETDARFHLVHENGEIVMAEKDRFRRTDPVCHDRVQAWLCPRVENLIEEIAEENGLDLWLASQRYARLRLPASESTLIKQWQFSPTLGVWREL
ncbi:MAG: type I-F CRISPR-associated helicase Cas3f [Granulosicoccaceae bacterium]